MLTSAYPNYVPDLVLHGLRKLFGERVVDFPRKDCVYEGICGQPNLDPVPGFMAADGAVDREDIGAKLAKGHFDLVICDIRAFNDRLALLQASICPLALLDGEDFAVPIRPGPYAILRRETDGNDFSIPVQMAVPAEILAWIDRHAGTEKTHSVGFLGSRGKLTPDRNAMLDELARIFPDGLIGAWAVGETAPGRDGYYRKLQSCKVVLTLPGAGNDTFRYWENSACAAVHVCKRMTLFIPDEFREDREIIKFDGIYELAAKVERILDGRIDANAMAERQRQWLLAHHTTERRAATMIDRLRRAFGS